MILKVGGLHARESAGSTHRSGLVSKTPGQYLPKHFGLHVEHHGARFAPLCILNGSNRRANTRYFMMGREVPPCDVVIAPLVVLHRHYQIFSAEEKSRSAIEELQEAERQSLEDGVEWTVCMSLTPTASTQ